MLELALVASLVLNEGDLEDYAPGTTTADYTFVNGHLQDVGSGFTKVSVQTQVPTPRYGYFPLVIHVDNTLGPKQTLKLSFSGSGGGGSHTYAKSVELAEHERRTVIIPVPAHQRYGVVHARGPGIAQGGDSSVYFNPVTTHQRGVLNLGTPDTFQQAVGSAPSYGGNAGTQVVSLTLLEAPSELLPYIGWDAVVLTGARFEELTEAQRGALEAYAAVGGNLVLMQGARGLGSSFPLLAQDTPGYGLGQVVFCDKCGYPRVLDLETTVPMRAIEPKGRRSRYVYYDDDGTPELSLPVAETPIGRFLIIIGMFTLAIGPGSVWVARRKGPSALLVTIPGTAAVTCALIVGYSILRDGFTVHATLQGFTMLDSKNHRAVTASVGAFYANLAPGGARFEPGTAIIAPTSSREYQSIDQAASMTFDDGVKVGADFIPSRSYLEWSFLSVQPTRARLVVKKQGDGVRVQNALGGELEWADVVVGERVFHVGPLKDGEEAIAQAIEPKRPSIEGALPQARVSGRALELLQGPIHDGDFSAVMKGSGFTPLGGLKLALADSHHFVRGSFER